MAPKKDETTPVEAAAAAAREAEDLDLFEEMAGLGSGATIRVCREPNNDFLDTIPPTAVEVENLKDMFGGGSYTLRARRDGKFIKGISLVRVRIAGAPKPGSPGQPLPGELTPTPLATAHPPGSVEARLDDIEAAVRGQSPDSSAAMLTMMSSLLVPVLTTALQRQPENSAVEILELARKLAKDQREAANQGRSDESDPIRDLGLPLLEVISKGLPAATPPVAALPPGPPEPENDAPQPLTPRELAARIAKWCEPYERRDSDPELRAECFLDDMRDSPLLGPCLDLIKLPDVLDLWAVAAPRVAEKREWYASFVDELRSLTRLDAPDPDADDTARDPGHEVHAPDDGKADPAREQDAGDPGAGA
jgi:hypothetical protein